MTASLCSFSIKAFYFDEQVKNKVFKQYEVLKTQYKFKNKHNVYYLVPDAYVSFEVLKKYYHINNDFIYSYLINKGFSVQVDAVSNADNTLHSMLSTFEQASVKDLIDNKEITKTISYGNTVLLGGKNIVVKTFLDNGYTSYIRSSKSLKDGKWGGSGPYFRL